MATHSSILAWRIPVDRGAWRATYSPWGRKELDMTWWLSTWYFTKLSQKEILKYFEISLTQLQNSILFFNILLNCGILILSVTKVVFVKENWILLGDHYITSIMLVKTVQSNCCCPWESSPSAQGRLTRNTQCWAYRQRGRLKSCGGSNATHPGRQRRCAWVQSWKTVRVFIKCKIPRSADRYTSQTRSS